MSTFTGGTFDIVNNTEWADHKAAVPWYHGAISCYFYLLIRIGIL